MMILFHLIYDLNEFGYTNIPLSNFWLTSYWRYLIVFLFLNAVGISLVLAYGNNFNLNKFIKRLFLLGLAALSVSISTYIMFPDAWVYFGILHSISVASLLGLAFLRLPAVVTLVLGAVVIALPNYVSLPALNSPFFYWTGLSTWWPPSIDYEPVFPWFGPALFGIGAAKAIAELVPSALSGSGRAGQGRLAQAIAFPGRHSLVIYLAHQPVLISVIWIYLMLS